MESKTDMTLSQMVGSMVVIFFIVFEKADMATCAHSVNVSVEHISPRQNSMIVFFAKYVNVFGVLGEGNHVN